MEGRTGDEPVAATRIVTGTDVDYGALTHHLVASSQRPPGLCASTICHRVTTLRARRDGRWRVEVEDLESGDRQSVTAKFVFIGAGGGALPLLAEIRHSEGKGYGGFPVSGIWLRCDDPAINKRHHAKVYGKAPRRIAADVGAASRHPRDRRPAFACCSGPMPASPASSSSTARCSTSFESVRPANVKPLLSVARDNFDLTEYLIEQVLQSESHRLATLDQYFPNAKRDDWKLQVAGQRVADHQA